MQVHKALSLKNSLAMQYLCAMAKLKPSNALGNAIYYREFILQFCTHMN